MEWTLLHPRATMSHLGCIPDFLSETDPRPAKEQIDANYQHGGGWNPRPTWKLLSSDAIRYPGDPALRPIAMTTLRQETIFFYEGAWLAIVQPDRSYEVGRVD